MQCNKNFIYKCYYKDFKKISIYFTIFNKNNCYDKSMIYHIDKINCNIINAIIKYCLRTCKGKNKIIFLAELFRKR